MDTPPHGLPEKPTTKKLQGPDNAAQSEDNEANQKDGNNPTIQDNKSD
jgi:hypothetical protein